MSALDSIPVLGSGMGFRHQIKDDIFAAKDDIDFVEIVTEQYLRNLLTTEALEEVCDVFPVIPHGVGLSIGSAARPSSDYLRGLKRISDITQAPYYSEHLCQTNAPGIDLGHLTPLWFTEETLAHTIDHVKLVQDTLGKPLVLENVTYRFEIPLFSMPQAEFFHRLVEATDCGVLLDLTNIFINSVNHGYSAVEFMDAMPLDRVVQTHIAGGYWRNKQVVDSHSHPVQEETWELLSLLKQRIEIKGIILEQDDKFPDIGILVSQIKKARNIGISP